MATETRSADARISVDTTTQILSGDLYAGEALNAVAACTIDSTGAVVHSDGTANNDAATVMGYTPRAYASGDAVDLILPPFVAKFSDAGLTIGQAVYVSATAGLMDDAATTGDSTGIGRAITTSDILFHSLKLAAATTA